METSLSRKIWSGAGLAVSIAMLSPVIKSIENLHGHTTRAAIYLVIFIMGLVVAGVSVTSPVYKA